MSVSVLGNRIPVCGGTCSVAPDWRMWFPVNTFTHITTIAVIYLTCDQWSAWEALLSALLVITNNAVSFILLFADPGIYPRPAMEEPPEKAAAAATYCRSCRLNRPLRTSHCYTCGVCVREHDHHCKVLGVCIGRRSLRWFVAYLLTMVLQLSLALFFLVRSFRRLPLESDWPTRAVPVGYSTWTEEAIDSFQSAATAALLEHMLTMALVGVLLIPVAAGTVTYVLLPLTDTTWREALSQGGVRLVRNEDTPSLWKSALSMKHLLSMLKRMGYNVDRMCRAGPSLLYHSDYEVEACYGSDGRGG